MVWIGRLRRHFFWWHWACSMMDSFRKVIVRLCMTLTAKGFVIHMHSMFDWYGRSAKGAYFFGHKSFQFERAISSSCFQVFTCLSEAHCKIPLTVLTVSSHTIGFPVGSAMLSVTVNFLVFKGFLWLKIHGFPRPYIVLVWSRVCVHTQ